MKAMLLTILVLAGCYPAGENTSSAKRTIGGDNAEDERTGSFRKECLVKLVEETKSLEFIGIGHFGIGEFKHTSGIELFVGEFEYSQRRGLDGGPFPKSPRGIYKKAYEALNQHGITCEDRGNNFVLIFPAANPSPDYDEITFNKEGWEEMLVDVGTFAEDDKRIAVTVYMSKENRDKEIHHLFDTDANGKIVRHVEMQDRDWKNRTAHLGNR